MSKRSHFVNCFKIRGIWWTHRTYKKYGEIRHCYSAKHSYNPIFSTTVLSYEQLIDLVDKQHHKYYE